MEFVNDEITDFFSEFRLNGPRGDRGKSEENEKFHADSAIQVGASFSSRFDSSPSRTGVAVEFSIAVARQKRLSLFLGFHLKASG